MAHLSVTLRARTILAGLALALLGACTEPQEKDYVSGGQASRSTGGENLGKNSAGEDCTQQRVGDGADVYCGSWLQPSARVRKAASGATLQSLATASAWRAGLNDRYICAEPTSTTVLGNQPALLLQCNRKVGGWAHVALVAAIDNTMWQADGVLPAFPALERSLGMRARPSQPVAEQTVSGAAQRLLAEREAAKAFGSDDIGRFDALIRVADDANRTEDFAGAEKNLRAAWEVQKKALGDDNPNIAGTVITLALQVSNQRRFAEAELLLQRAERLAGGADDDIQRVRLLHYRGLHAANQGRIEDAIELLDRAAAGYAALLPPEIVNAKPVPLMRAGSAVGSMSDLLPNRDLLAAPGTRTALLGLVEARRKQAILLRRAGRLTEGEARLRSANDLAIGNGLRQPVITARLARTTAGVVAETSGADAAAAEYERAASVYASALPNSRPLAETMLLHVGQMTRSGARGDASGICVKAVSVLRELRIGADPKLLSPCLGVFAAAAKASTGDEQKWLTEMFEAAQLVQGGVTSQQIAQATARLSENARDQKVGDAVRAHEDARDLLAALYRERDQDDQSRSIVTDAQVKLEQKIRDAKDKLDEAGEALQSASPNYGQLVQQAVPAKDVFSALAPGEAFISIVLDETAGWSFALRNGRIAVAPVPGGMVEMKRLVKAVRASIEVENGRVPRFDVTAARDVYKAALGGLDAMLRDATALVIVPIGPLLSLPFELLLTAEADPDALAEAPWLVQRSTISHVPAAANFVSLRKIAGTSRAARPWFGFGDFRPATLAQASRTFGPGCARDAQEYARIPLLPGAVQELHDATTTFAATRNEVLRGAAFTVQAVKAAPLKDYRILHFATHALLSTDLNCPSEPAIVASTPAGAENADASRLTASKVLGLDLDAVTVILSACNSGGPDGSAAGESLSGLARSFFYAGARSLMVTHWSVDDDTTAALVADTLRRFRSNESGGIAAATRAAQRHILAQAGKTRPAYLAHPFFWAPFAVIGDGGQSSAPTQAAVSVGRAAGL